MRKRHQKSGFTLVELSIAIAFISMLSIMITLIISNVVAAYQRGLTLKQVNLVGSEIIEDFKAAIASSSAKNITDVCATNFADQTRDDCVESPEIVSFMKKGTVKIRGEDVSNVPIRGAFCSGTYSYLWNSGYLFDSSSYQTGEPKLKFIYKNSAGALKEIDDLRLLKVSDPERAICLAKMTNSLPQDNIIDISGYNSLQEDPIELLPATNEYGLAIYSLDLAKPAQDTLNRNILYSGYFILATVRGGINIKTNSNLCASPAEQSKTDFNYCAINKFNFAMQATGE